MMTKNSHSISGFIINRIKSKFKFVAFYDWPMSHFLSLSLITDKK